MSEEKPMPTVETSLKYMAWNIKEMSQYFKDLGTVMKSIDLSLKKLCDKTCSKDSSKIQSINNEEIPF